jgi:hypothetical protein
MDKHPVVPYTRPTHKAAPKVSHFKTFVENTKRRIRIAFWYSTAVFVVFATGYIYAVFTNVEVKAGVAEKASVVTSVVKTEKEVINNSDIKDYAAYLVKDG